MRRGIRPLLAMAVATSIAFAAAACGDDDDSAARGTGNRFCAAKVEFDSIPQQSERYPADAKGALEELAARAPGVLSDSVSTIQAGYEKMATGDEAVFEDPAFVGAQSDVTEWVRDNCGFEKIDVTSVDYSFEGLPDRIDAGRVSFTNVNKGKEPHVAVVMKIPEDTKNPMELLETMNGPEPPAGVTMINAAFVPPGGLAGFTADLDAGRYFVYCDVPIGGGESGDPHFLHGMQGTFTVV